MNFLRRLVFNLKYFGNPPWDTGISPPELVSFLANAPPGKALDLGCGTGTNVITLANYGWQTTGVDFAQQAIRVAQRKAHHAGLNIDLRVGDVTQMTGVNGQYDLILDIGCYHGLSSNQRQLYIRKMKSLLVHGGTYLLYAFLRSGEEQSRIGLDQPDLDEFSRFLKLVKRQDGADRGQISSVWLMYRRL